LHILWRSKTIKAEVAILKEAILEVIKIKKKLFEVTQSLHNAVHGHTFKLTEGQRTKYILWLTKKSFEHQSVTTLLNLSKEVEQIDEPIRMRKARQSLSCKQVDE